jgi:Dehydrogenases (flavoproteins)
MSYYIEKPKIIPILTEVDVLVAGAGPSGVAAAVSAARNGAKTMLLEQSGDVGGVSTNGLMSHWTGNTKGGIYEEILDRSCDDKSMRTTINPEKLKLCLLELLNEAGVTLQLYTFASDTIVENGEVKGIIIESKSGRQAIYSKVVIDATGDGDIAAKAGAPYFKGRETDGKMQPMTLMFKVGGVNCETALFPPSFETTFPVPKGDLQSLARKHLPAPAGHVLLYRSTLPGVVTCNMTNCTEVDGTNAADLTRATILCRKQIPLIVDFLHEYVPGYEACYLLSSASMIGVRETRHFEGEKTLTENDILEARVFDDWAVTKAHFNFDIHNIKGAGLDEHGAQHKFKQNKGYTIPYGCLVPKKVDGLLLCGRNISGTHVAHSNFRAMPICANIGQAAGIAAALCVKTEVKPRELDVKQLQKALKKAGVTLDENE